MTTTKLLSAKLKELRTKNNYTQTDIANYLNISRQSVSKWESGITTPDLENLVLLAELYNVSIDELLTRNTSPTIPETTPDYQDSFNTALPFLEKLGLSIILILSTNFPYCGIPVSIIVAIWLKRTNRSYKIIYLLCLFCILLGFHELFIMYTHINTNIGPSFIEPIN